ncbi:MAG TPA: NUDIX domain-containing protein [Terriglobales bacterium]|jgi:isopentenyl-diphosphate delta-isomerase|nr:NUDIX domain-containing protein [Terriglobales bacterium]
MEYVDVLDSSGCSVGKIKPKSEVHRDGDWHGAAHVWILNTKGQILIQRRAPTKENWPSLWDVSVAGHLSAGEGPVEAVLREAREELGVTLDPSECRYLFTAAEQVALNNGTYVDNEYHYVFLVERDFEVESLKFSDGEVAEVRFVALRELQTNLTTDPSGFVPHEEEYRRLFEVLRT